MKLRLLLGLALSGLLCGCGSSGGGGQTVTSNSSHRTGPPPIAARGSAWEIRSRIAFIYAHAFQSGCQRNHKRESQLTCERFAVRAAEKLTAFRELECFTQRI